MNIKNTFIAGILAVTSFSSVLAEVNPVGSGSGTDFQKVGGSGAQFLKIGVGARGTGMAGAFSAVSNDISSIYWNPAGLAYTNGMNAMFSYTSWFAGFSQNFAALSLPVGEKFRVALSATTFGSGDIEVTTLTKPEGTGAFYNISDVMIGATLSGLLTEQFAFGATVKYLRQGFASVSASTFLFDLGTSYNTGIEGIKLGFTINNFGSSTAFTGQNLTTAFNQVNGLNLRPVDYNIQTNDYTLPLSFRAGLAWDVVGGDVKTGEPAPEHKLTVASDFETISDTREQYSVGAEYTYDGFISLRSGYRFNHSQLGFAGGIGFNYESSAFNGSVDYSINTTTVLGLIHRIGVNIVIK